MLKQKISIKIILTLVISNVLGGCGIYRSSFICPDAKGADCYSMEAVDKMISSGEIEVFNESCRCSKGKKYKNIKSLQLKGNKKIKHYFVADK